MLQRTPSSGRSPSPFSASVDIRVYTTHEKGTEERSYVDDTMNNMYNGLVSIGFNINYTGDEVLCMYGTRIKGGALKAVKVINYCLDRHMGDWSRLYSTFNIDITDSKGTTVTVNR